MRQFGVSANYTESVVCKTPELVVGEELVTRIGRDERGKEADVGHLPGTQGSFTLDIKMQRLDRDATHNNCRGQTNTSNQIGH